MRVGLLISLLLITDVSSAQIAFEWWVKRVTVMGEVKPVECRRQKALLQYEKTRLAYLSDTDTLDLVKDINDKWTNLFNGDQYSVNVFTEKEGHVSLFLTPVKPKRSRTGLIISSYPICTTDPQ
jgi:hypothetical protein